MRTPFEGGLGYGRLAPRTRVGVRHKPLTGGGRGGLRAVSPSASPLRAAVRRQTAPEESTALQKGLEGDSYAQIASVDLGSQARPGELPCLAWAGWGRLGARDRSCGRARQPSRKRPGAHMIGFGRLVALRHCYRQSSTLAHLGSGLGGGAGEEWPGPAGR